MAVVALISAVALYVVAIPPPARKPHRKHAAGDLSQILSIQVGQDTIEELEKRLGPGAPCMGGHPHGGRAWFLRDQKIWVYADGFEYHAKGGRIIDQVVLGSVKQDLPYDFDFESPKQSVPEVRTPRRPVGWMGRIVPGMSRARVLELTAHLPRPQVDGDTLVWSQPASSVGSMSQQALRAELAFDGGILTHLAIATR